MKISALKGSVNRILVFFMVTVQILLFSAVYPVNGAGGQIRATEGGTLATTAKAPIQAANKTTQAVVPESVQPAEKPVQLQPVKGIRFETAVGSHVISIEAPASVHCDIKLFEKPYRLVVDMADAKLAALKPGSVEAGGDGRGPVQRIRYSQFSPTVVRVVADLTEPCRYTVSKAPAGDRLLISLSGSISAPAFYLGADDGTYAPPVGASVVFAIGGIDKPTPKITYLKAPERVVIDLPLTKTVAGLKADKLKFGPVTGVRTTKFGSDTYRIILDLSCPMGFIDASAKGGGDVLIYLIPQVQSICIGNSPSESWVSFVFSSPLPRESLSVSPPAADSKGRYLPLSLMNTASDQLVSPMGADLLGTVVRVDAKQGTKGLEVKIWLSAASAYRSEVLADGREIRLYFSAQPLKGRTIIVDPGHGGGDPGAVGPTGVMEKHITLAIALKLADLLTGSGANALMTRDTDIFVPLTERWGFGADKAPDAFVSVHANSSVGEAVGTETWYSKSSVPASEKLAQSIQDSMVRELELVDRRVKFAEFAVTRRQTIPAVLVETAFISTAAEEKFLADEQFQQRIAQAIFDGISSYYRGNSVASVK